MSVEWLWLSLLLPLALWPVVRYARSTALWILVGGLGGATVASAVWWQGRLTQSASARQALTAKVPSQGRPGGYISSDSCQACHPDQYASWHRSYHRTMTQLPTATSVRGNFTHVTLELDGQSYHLERKGDEFWVEMVDPDWSYVQMLKRVAQARGQGPGPENDPHPPRVRKRISLLTGSHHMQAYWVPGEFGNTQYGFPFTYLFEQERWVPRRDVFLLDPATRFAQQVWNVGCISCHATAGQPRQDPQSKIFDTRTAELGIACEACHGPAERHLKAHESPLHRVIARRQDHADPTIFNPGRADHVKSAEACGQCHAIRHNRHLDQWHQHGVQFQPGGDLEARAPLVHYDGTDLEVPGNEKKRALMEGSFWSDGQVRVSGREFNGLAATACFTRGQMSCLSCHSLHHYQDTDDQLGRGMDGNQACLQCHDSIGKNLTRHTHHPTGSSGSLCYNCHMPHTSYGLLKAIRSHTIDSPTVATSVKTGRPNACNLCHLDRSLGWTQRHLEEWYGTPKVTLSAEEETLSAAVLWLLKGDAGQRALLAWHLGWPTARAVSGTNWLVPFLAETLTDPYAVVRYIGERSLKSIPGFEQLVYDYVGPATERQRARQQILDAWRKAPRPVDAPSGTVLLEASGAMQEGAIRALLRQRNHRKMELLE